MTEMAPPPDPPADYGLQVVVRRGSSAARAAHGQACGVLASEHCDRAHSQYGAEQPAEFRFASFGDGEAMVLLEDGRATAGSRVRGGLCPELFAVKSSLAGSGASTPSDRHLAKASAAARCRPALTDRERGSPREAAGGGGDGGAGPASRVASEEWETSSTPPLQSASSASSPGAPASPLATHPPPPLPPAAPAADAPRTATPAGAPWRAAGATTSDSPCPSPQPRVRVAPPSPGNFGPRSAGGSGSGAGRSGRESRIARALSSGRLVGGYGSGTAAGTLSERDPLPHSIRVLREERVFQARLWEGRFISLWRKRVFVVSCGLLSVRGPSEGHRPLFYLNAVTRVQPLAQGPTPFALAVTAVVAVRPDRELLRAADNAPPSDSDEEPSGDERERERERARRREAEGDSPKLSPLASVIRSIGQAARRVGGAAATQACSSLAAGEAAAAARRRKASGAIATPRIEERQFMLCMESEADFRAVSELLDPDAEAGVDHPGGSTTSTHSLLW
eukprot:tig00021616_g22922.t1